MRDVGGSYYTPVSDFVTVTLKYSRLGLLKISDEARTAVTVDALREQATSKWDSRLNEVDFSIFSDDEHSHVVSDDYLRNAKYPRTLYMKTKQIGFSEFSEDDALKYAGVRTIKTVDDSDDRFPESDTIPDDHDLLLHAVKDLKLKHALYNPLEQGCEYTRR